MNQISHGMNQESAQASNRTLVLNLIRKEKVCSRASIAKTTHLKQATITYITNDLIKSGLIREVGLIQGSKGRRSIGITIDNINYGVIAIRLARKNYSVGVFDLAGQFIEKKIYSTEEFNTPQATLNNIEESIKTLQNKYKNRRILAIGISVPGPFNIKQGKIALMTETMGWENISIEKELYQKFQLPVLLEQDANAGALAQLWYSKADYSTGVLIYISAGQGIGSGILVNGEILHGSMGMAGEIGHTTIDFNGPQCACGNRGCLEKYCSTISFTNAVNVENQKKTDYSFEDIAKRIKEGDQYCFEKYLKCCDYIAVGITNIINSFNPNVILIGDEMVNIMPDVFIERVNEKVRERVLPEIWENTLITYSAISQEAELYGAAIIVIRDIYKRYSEYMH